MPHNTSPHCLHDLLQAALASRQHQQREKAVHLAGIAPVIHRDPGLREPFGVRLAFVPQDVVLGGESSGDGPFTWKEPLRVYEEVGATWWLELLTDWRGTVDQMRGYVRAGPPRE